ncbi:MAG TPA: SOS response-associated peptidase [Mycobacteriales bacterium]|jgi:putative SOS response-associated peptidase YedK|nr:SOS response-associated peptidase [Mycobacteriales bacterium]
MCGRYSASRPSSLLAETYAATVADEPPAPSWNVAPTDPVAVVVERPAGREVRTLRWGLIPSWAEDRRIASRLINARAETVATKPAFRAALARRRCLVPADGWYEWRAEPGRAKQPFFITARAGAGVAFAGLYEVWRDPATEELVRTCTVVTTSACPELAYLHERMPVVLAPGAWDAWLDPAYDDVASLAGLLVPCDGFGAHPVSVAVNSVRNNGPQLTEPLPADEALF